MTYNRDLVITGLPRSGTSLLCARVNEFQNAVVINEPVEIFRELKGGSIDGLSKIFGQYRQAIGEGKPVYNKIKNGKFIEDTRLEDSRSLHMHPIDNEQFTLGIKNTLIFMAMLSKITRSKAFPKVIASIRHPYDCIGSWHNVDFPHLKQSRPEFLTEYATGLFAERISDVLNTNDLFLRSANLWVLLAQTLLAAKGKIHVVRYEDMVTKPERTYQGISMYLGFKSNANTQFYSSPPVRHREELSESQKAVIDSACNKVAVQFGYKMS